MNFRVISKSETSVTEHRVYWNNWSIGGLITSYGAWTTVYITGYNSETAKPEDVYMHA